MSLEPKNTFLSDITYLAFEKFMKELVPEYIMEGIKTRKKNIYILFRNTDMGLYVGNHNLGKINYPEFISYVYGLSSFKAFRLKNVEGIINNYNAPFDLEGLIDDYYGELQSDEYFSLDISNEGENKTLENSTYLAYVNFSDNIMGEILKEALEGIYQIEDILGENGITIRNLYIPLEIKYGNFFIGKYNLGRVNYLEFLNYLTNFPSYMGIKGNDLEQAISFNMEQLINDYKGQLTIR